MDYNQTVINPLVLSFTIVSCFIIIAVKKEYIIIPLILIACFITKMQRIVIFTIDFPMLRILIICGFIRIFIRGEYKSMILNKIDKLMIIWAVSRLITHSLLWMSLGAFIQALGDTLDTVGAYFIIRIAISDFKEYDTLIKTLIFVSIPIAILMTYEQNTSRNLFSVFGGVPEFNLVREGKLRSQGAFSHPIMAGTFGAVIIPLAWGLWQRKKGLFPIIGFISATIITITSSSSGPAITFAVGFFGIIFWNFRKYYKSVKYGSIILLILLQIVMKAPVWHLISRIDLVGGSTGYHRYFLINNAITRFYEWILLGIRSTAHWGYGQEDLTNMYIFEGAYGGIIPLILFILIIRHSFKIIGLARAKLEQSIDSQKYVWSFGVTLFAHVISFIAVSYFGQMVFFYFMLIAMISSLNNLSYELNDKTIT